MSAPRRLRVLVLIACALAYGGLAHVAIAGPGGGRTVSYRGFAVRVPRSWPVIDLSRDPHACVRFDRHAVYLGSPSPDENCPAHAVGRTDALLLEPAGSSSSAQRLEGNADTFVVPSAGVRVTATWARSPSIVAQALGRKTLPAKRRIASPQVRLETHAARQAPVFTGLGFDRCAAPSSPQMSAWKSSPYRAVGIYIGGANSACLQPNLTSSWVSRQVAAGWHPVPIYVGLQAPSNSCGCQAMSSKTTKAKAQGRAAALDAVAEAQGLGLPAGSAIYNDMESYSPNRRNTSAVLAFLAAWTSKLHAEGYVSGVYSSASSGIRDLVKRYGTSYPEPNDIWIADWNGRPTTSDPFVPSRDWAIHRRLHQYRGGSTETYDKVTLNVDDDYLDGATAAAGQDGYTVLSSDGGVKAFGSARFHGSDAGKLASGVSAVSLATDAATGGYWILKSNGAVDNFHAPARGSVRKTLGSLRAIAIAAPPGGGYLILTSDGGVHGFGGAKTHGSDAGKLRAGVTAVGLAVDFKSRGYWILKSNGGVDNFNAPWKGSLKNKLGKSLPVAIAAPPHGGYLVLLSNGGVHKFGPAATYGSDAGKLSAGVTAVSLATSAKLAGYRILRSDGGIDSFDATWAGSLLGHLPAGVQPVAVASGG